MNARIATREENAIALYEEGKIPAPQVDLAQEFCSRSKVGEHKCSVQTRYGWSCDICLEEELMSLYASGIHTINSCCGHGNPDLACILVVGEESRDKMAGRGYELVGTIGDGLTMWRPKTKLISTI